MSSKIGTMKSTSGYWDKIQEAGSKIQNADAVLIGAGAGLSASAGFTYSGKRFADNFPDFIEKYGFKDMYSAGFYPYKTLEEYWAYWSRYVFINRYQDAPRSVYDDLYHLVQDKDYFVLTTNVDHCFQKAGVDKQRLFYTQGDYGLWQCSIPCCPVCGAPMAMNLRADNTFVEDDGWHLAAQRYETFLQSHRDLSIVYLELGVGGNTPGIIKYPFWRMTAENPKAVYVCVNLGEAHVPVEIAERSICIHADIGEMLGGIRNYQVKSRHVH